MEIGYADAKPHICDMERPSRHSLKISGNTLLMTICFIAFGFVTGIKCPECSNQNNSFLDAFTFL